MNNAMVQALVQAVDLAQWACTAALFGIIWLVQWVHYPSFHRVDPRQWMDFHRRHSSMTGLVVAPLMIGEMAAAVLAFGLADPASRGPADVCALGLLVVIWGVTFGCSVPAHRRLAKGYDRAVVDRLIRTNGIRTAAWTLRFLLLFDRMLAAD